MSKLLMAQRVATAVLLALLVNHFRPVYSLIKHAFLEPLPESPIDYASCQHIRSPGVDSCEDMATWYTENGDELQIVGCDPGRRNWNTVMGPTRNGSSTGNLFVVSSQGGKIEPLEVASFPVEHTFHPLGLAVWHEEGKDRLLVINHAEDMSTVEVFDLKERPTRAEWVTTLRGDDGLGIIAPNSIVALSHNSFYLTHDHYITRRKMEQQVFPFKLLPNFLNPIIPILNILETYLLLRTGSVTHVSFIPPPHPNLPTYQVSKLVLHGIPFANGIALSPDATHALVASTSTSRVLLYSIGSEFSDPLKLIRGWDMPFHPDNIVWRVDPQDPRRSIALIAGHRSSPLVSKIARGAQGVKAPSFVSQLVFPDNLDAVRAQKMSGIKLETVFTDGGDFGTSTSAEIDGFGALWVAGLYQEGLLRCEGVRHVPGPVLTEDEEIF